MPKKRVIAYFMHEDEMAKAQGQMPGAISTDSYVVGELDDGGINTLRTQGLIVQELPESVVGAMPAPAEVHGMPPGARLRAAAGPLMAAATAPDMTKTQFFL